MCNKKMFSTKDWVKIMQTTNLNFPAFPLFPIHQHFQYFYFTFYILKNAQMVNGILTIFDRIFFCQGVRFFLSCQMEFESWIIISDKISSIYYWTLNYSYISFLLSAINQLTIGHHQKFPRIIKFACWGYF